MQTGRVCPGLTGAFVNQLLLTKAFGRYWLLVPPLFFSNRLSKPRQGIGPLFPTFRACWAYLDRTATSLELKTTAATQREIKPRIIVRLNLVHAVTTWPRSSAAVLRQTIHTLAGDLNAPRWLRESSALLRREIRERPDPYGGFSSWPRN